MDSKLYPQGSGSLKSRYVDGSLVFYTVAGVEIYRINPITGIVTYAASKLSVPSVNSLIAYLADRMLTIATITVSGGDATKYKTTTTCAFQIAGITYTKVATDSLTFTTADTINLAGAATVNHWGAWLVSIGADGTPHTTHATYTSGTDQNYANEAAAIAALPAPAASHVQIGYFTVQGLASTAWTANTSNFTVGGGAGNCTARTFYDLPLPVTLPAAV